MDSMTEMPRKVVPPPLELVKSRIDEVLPPDVKAEVEVGRGRDRRHPRRRPVRGGAHRGGGQRAGRRERRRTATPTSSPRAIADAVGGKPALLYCNSGNRSARAADALTNEHGVEGVRSLIGGITLWNDLGLPIEGEIAADEDDETRGGRGLMEAGTLKIEDIKQKIEHLTPEEALEEIQAGGDFVLLDTREPHEYAEAHLEGAKLVPPAEVAEQIDEIAPDTSQRLHRLLPHRQPLRPRRPPARGAGLRERRRTSIGGIVEWQEKGLPVAEAEGMTARPARALLAPHPAARGRRRGPDQASELQGAAAGRRRARLADRALPGRGRDRHARPRRRRRRRRVEPAAPGHPLDRPRRRPQDRVGEGRRSTA